VSRYPDGQITIVSGLPRSGTSLVMQMLEAGGMPILTDGLRCADIDNPRGYFEYEPVKRTAVDSTWLEFAQGKAVKMACPLLRALPRPYSYRVIIPVRDSEEIVASQNTMLRRNGKSLGPPPDQVMARSLESHLRQTKEWLGHQPNFKTVWIAHSLLINAPLHAARTLGAFCGGLTIEPMAAVVELALYRNRKSVVV
jgi:hypothetical protein